MRRECRERFHRHRGLAIPTCITARASRTCRDACRDCLTSGFLWSQWWGKRSRYSWRMRNPQFYVSGKRPMVATCEFTEWYMFFYVDLCLCCHMTLLGHNMLMVNVLGFCVMPPMGDVRRIISHRSIKFSWDSIDDRIIWTKVDHDDKND